MTAPQEQFAEAVRRSQAAAAEVVRTWATLTTSTAGAAASVAPKSDWDSTALIDQAFDFAARMLADQRDLTKKLIQLSGQMSESSQSEAASAVSRTRSRAKSASTEAEKQADATLGAARRNAEDARRAAIDATNVMLQTARQGAETMLEAAQQVLPSAAAGMPTSSAPSTVSAPQAPAAASASAASPPSRPQRRPSRPRRRPSLLRSRSPGRDGRPERPSRARSPPRSCRRTTSSMGKAELQALLVAHGLPKSGNVPELRDRLRAHDAS